MIDVTHPRNRSNRLRNNMLPYGKDERNALVAFLFVDSRY